MDFAEVVRLADMIVASGKPAAGVLGGEPTLHPQFAEIVEYLLRRGIKPTVFTNGICSDDAADAIDRIPGRQGLEFVVNVNAPGVDPPAAAARQEAFLRRFAGLCNLGVNLYRADLDPAFAIGIAMRAGIRKGVIRVGLAQPALDEPNEWLRLEHYPRAAESVTKLAEAAFGIGMKVSLDCGFPLCSFTDGQLGRLVRNGTVAKFYCRPAVDLGPNGAAWACFPLAKSTRTTIRRSTRLDDLYDRFVAMKTEIRDRTRVGVFDECSTCAHMRRGVCEGGCLAHALTARAARESAR